MFLFNGVEMMNLFLGILGTGLVAYACVQAFFYGATNLIGKAYGWSFAFFSLACFGSFFFGLGVLTIWKSLMDIAQCRA
jgi:hypothetical protein